MDTAQAKLKKRIENGKIIEQKCWEYLRELNSFSDERLDSVALIDFKRSYTYRQMFRKWENYAEVFSALNMTGARHARVGLLPEISANSIFAFYALNMTGASVSMLPFADLLDKERCATLIKKERITDLVLCDTRLTPELLGRLARSREALGLGSIIVLHVPVDGAYVTPAFAANFNMNLPKLRQIPGVLFMGQLLKQYEAMPIAYSKGGSVDDAVILHTSGTTSGIHKPVPLSDRALNEAAARFLRDGRFSAYEGNAVSAVIADLSNSYMLADATHLPFSFGGTVLTFPLGAYNPKFYEAMARHKANIMITSPGVLGITGMYPMRIDFSSISFFFVGGDAVSVDDKRRFNEMIRKNGSKVGITIGYGLSELGGACILSDPDREDNAIGYPLPGITVKIFDESDGKFYDLSDGPRTGVLYLSSASMSCGRIDDQEYFALKEIDGKPFYNTYDLVSVAEDGSLTYDGRMNKFFVNNEGIRFDAGLVESAVGAQPGIAQCGLVPVYNKIIHDTAPVLYVRVAPGGGNPAQTVRNALINTFIQENHIEKTNMPGQCVIADALPQTELGKVDVHRIAKGGVNGKWYMIRPIRFNGALKDIALIPVPANPDWAGIPEELEGITDETLKLYKLIMPDADLDNFYGAKFEQPGAASAQPGGSFQEGINMFIRALSNPLALGCLLRPGLGVDKLIAIGGAAIYALGYAQGMSAQGAQPQGNAQANPMQGLGCYPNMAAQPQGNAQANPMQGLGCYPNMAAQPQGNAQVNPMQGLGCYPNMAAQGQGNAQVNPMQGLGCYPNMAAQGQSFDSSQLNSLLGRFFNASTASEFYEE